MIPAERDEGTGMKARTLTGIAVCIMATAAFPTVATAAPAGSGASVVVQQNGETTHRMCGGVETFLAASGFAPARKSVDVTLIQVPGGVINTVRIPLSDGSGTLDVGHDLVPLTYKLRLRFQTGSSEHTGNNGSYSADLQIC